MSAHGDLFWRDRAAVRYLDALDAGDMDAIASLWDEAATNPELEALLHELNEGLDGEEGAEADFAADAARVLALARRYLPTAFTTEGAPGPLTASEVARRLESEPEFRRLDPGDRIAHARLLAEAAPIPDALGQPQLDDWLQGLNVSTGPSYRRLFRKVAVLMSMACCQQQGRLAAARRTAPPSSPKGERP